MSDALMDNNTRLACCRLAYQWAESLADRDALPAVLVGLAFGPDGSPMLHVAMGDGMSTADARMLLADVVGAIDAGPVQETGNGTKALGKPPGRPRRRPD